MLEAIYNSSCSAENENYYSIKNYQKKERKKRKNTLFILRPTQSSWQWPQVAVIHLFHAWQNSVPNFDGEHDKYWGIRMKTIFVSFKT